MSPFSSPVVALFFSLSLLLSVADAFNITTILSQFPDFTTFNNYLIQTGVAGEINNEHTVTVLVVANGNMAEVSGLSQEALKKTLSVHVILDYFDEQKLKNLPNNKTSTLTTLYQQSGQAQNQQGFLNVAHVGGGVAFGSAAPGSSLDSTFVKPVSSQPYNISVLQISNVINLASNSTASSPPSPPPQAPASSPAPKSQPPAASPAPKTETPAASPPRKVLAPAPSPKKASPPADADSPVASPPDQSAMAPAADSPADSPVNTAADSPDSGEADMKSSAVSVTSGNYLAAIPMLFASSWFLLAMI